MIPLNNDTPDRTRCWIVIGRESSPSGTAAQPLCLSEYLGQSTSKNTSWAEKQHITCSGKFFLRIGKVLGGWVVLVWERVSHIWEVWRVRLIHHDYSSYALLSATNTHQLRNSNPVLVTRRPRRRRETWLDLNILATDSLNFWMTERSMQPLNLHVALIQATTMLSSRLRVIILFIGSITKSCTNASGEVVQNSTQLTQVSIKTPRSRCLFLIYTLSQTARKFYNKTLIRQRSMGVIIMLCSWEVVRGAGVQLAKVDTRVCLRRRLTPQNAPRLKTSKTPQLFIKPV